VPAAFAANVALAKDAAANALPPIKAVPEPVTTPMMLMFPP
jgi:hypothetical protein